MRCLAQAIAWVLAVGCGGAAYRPIEVTERRVETATASEVRVVALSRATPDVVQLTLWVDAGSRDGEPPQIAVLAAWAAVQGLGNRIEPVVYPDATSFVLECAREEMQACVMALSAILARRVVDPALHATLRARLERVRREARSRPTWFADDLALRALLGASAASFQPLGQPEGDTDATVARVEQFLRDHYGRERALVVGVGDLEQPALLAEVGRAFASVRRSGVIRRARVVQAVPAAAPEVELSERAQLTVAVAMSSQDAVLGLIDFVRDHTAHHPLPVAELLPVRGGTIALVQLGAVRADDPRVDEVLTLLELGLAEGVRVRSGREPTTGVDVARDIGLVWVTEQPDGAAPAESMRAAAIGALAAVPPSPRANEAADRQFRDRAIRALGDVHERARQRASTPIQGNVGTTEASGRSSSGARLEVRRWTQEPDLALAFRVRGGAAQDPAAWRGRAAVASMVLARACEPALHPDLARIYDPSDFHASAFVDGASWGVDVSAPSWAWREATELLADCALRREATRDDVEAARASSLTDGASDSRRLVAWASRALPEVGAGWVAPWGTREGIAAVPADALLEWIGKARVGSRVFVSVVGDFPVEEITARWIRRLSGLRAESDAEVLPESAAPGTDMFAESWDESTPRVVIAWPVSLDSDVDPHDARLGARAFAERTGAHLASAAGIRVVEIGSGARSGAAWAWLAADVSDVVLDTLPARVAQAVNPQDRADRFAAVLDDVFRRAAWELDRPNVLAHLLVSRGVGGDGEGGDADDARSVLEALREARARYVIGRLATGAPSSGPH